MSKRFARNVENFTCEHCGAAVKGNGYTNHCSRCWWSKHVDINPGDRLASCGGMMEPIALEGSSPDYRIVHRCIKCGFERRQDVAGTDDPEALVALANKV